jgi:N-acetylglutamate synthase-like GNAT family acetyltransferase
MGLDWHRFIVAVDQAGRLAGCGQIKTHRDGSIELASIAVSREYRGRGIARSIIERLIRRAGRPLYLMCRASLEPFYGKWGFVSVESTEMPPYFGRVWRLASWAGRLAKTPDELSVMVLM